ncbi:MAG TPA: hypothetical protein VMM59_05950 [Thermohalobaculum sp.]|nr:hypothetical protein [Thermohalobaculum sp.]
MMMRRWIGKRLGLPEGHPERTLWLIGETFEAFEAVAPAIAEIRRRYVRTEILLSAGDAGLRARLAARFTGCLVLPRPAGFAPLVHMFVRDRNVRVTVFLEPAGTPSYALLGTLRRMAIATVATTGGDSPALAPGRPLAQACEAIVEIDERALDGDAQGPRGQRLPAARLADLLGALLARDLKPLRRVALVPRSLGGLLLKLDEHPRWKRLIAWRVRRYTTIAQLRDELGTPGTILCLGNGPSSEGPALDAMAYDALFRVNHSWLARGRFTRPDVVFTGGKSTMRALAEPILGVQTRYAEERCAEIRALARSRRPARFFSANVLCPEIRAFPWGVLRPTNGASMMAVAVALQPARLIVAGIDLFQHAAGSYPGDTSTPNAYSPGHSRETELAFLLNMLSNYRGELVIVGEVLQAEWEKFRGAAPRRREIS